MFLAGLIKGSRSLTPTQAWTCVLLFLFRWLMNKPNCYRWPSYGNRPRGKFLHTLPGPFLSAVVRLLQPIGAMTSCKPATKKCTNLSEGDGSSQRVRKPNKLPWFEFSHFRRNINIDYISCWPTLLFVFDGMHPYEAGLTLAYLPFSK